MRGWELEPVSFELAVPGEHNRRNAATALAALALAGVERADAEPVLARFRGAGRRFELVGEKSGVTVVDDYAHHPIRDRGDRRGGARALVAAGCSCSSSRTSTPAPATSRTSSAPRCRPPTRRASPRSTGAREQPVEGVGGKLVVDALRPGMRAGWAPAVEDGAALVAAWARPGDLVLTVGAGDVERAGPLVLEALA